MNPTCGKYQDGQPILCVAKVTFIIFFSVFTCISTLTSLSSTLRLKSILPTCLQPFRAEARGWKSLSPLCFPAEYPTCLLQKEWSKSVFSVNSFLNITSSLADTTSRPIRHSTFKYYDFSSFIVPLYSRIFKCLLKKLQDSQM